MKVLNLNAYYKPEQTSGSHLGSDFREALVQAGHTIELYAPTPTRGVSKEVRAEYKKAKKNESELDGALQVHRFSLYREGKNPIGRALRYMIMEVQLFWFGLRAKDIDILPISGTPPIHGLVAVLLKKIKKMPYIFMVQDMFPESLVSTGMTKRGSLLWKAGSWISNTTYRNANHIIVISDSMKKTLIEKGVPEEKITVTYNWINTDTTYHIPREENPLFEELGLSREKFYITYAGNLGHSQNVDILVDCAEKLQDKEDICFVIFGGGTGKDRLEKRIEKSGLKNICLLPLQPIEKVSQVYSLGDVSFVTCKKGVGEGAFPSKAVSIMATATPIIASFDLDSDLCRIVEQAQVGISADAEDTEAATQAILKLYGDRDLVKEMGGNARKLVCERFSREAGTGARVAVLEKYARN